MKYGIPVIVACCLILLSLSCGNTNKVLSKKLEQNTYETQYLLDYFNDNPNELTELPYSKDPKIHYTISMGVDSTFFFLYKSVNPEGGADVVSDLELRDKILREIKRIDPKSEELSYSKFTIKIKSHSFELYKALCEMKTVYAIETPSQRYIVKAMEKGYRFPLWEQYFEALENMKDF